MCIGRTNLPVDRRPLEEAPWDLGLNVCSAAIKSSLADVLRVRKIQGVFRLFT